MNNNNKTEPTTVRELYEFFQQLEWDEFLPWLENHWKGKDKQESSLRLFAELGLIPKLDAYNMCEGNFNLKTIKEIEKLRDIFSKSLKDKGDSSDLTGIHKSDKKRLLATTSKNLNKTNIGGLDITQIDFYFEQRYKPDGYTLDLCIVIRDFAEFQQMIDRSEKTNELLKSYIEKPRTVIIDWNDLVEAFHNFKHIFNTTPIENITDSNKKLLILEKISSDLAFERDYEIVARKYLKLWKEKKRFYY